MLAKIESRTLYSLLILSGKNKLSGTDLLIDEADFSLRFMDRGGKDYIQVDFTAEGLDWIMICFPGWMKEFLESFANYYGFIVEDSPITIIVDGKEIEIPIGGQRIYLLNRYKDSIMEPGMEKWLRDGILQRLVAYV